MTEIVVLVQHIHFMEKINMINWLCKPFCELKIVDVDNAKNMSIGEVEELMVKGPITMMGYLGDEKRTKETLENDDGFTLRFGKMDEDGYYYIVDRKRYDSTASQMFIP